MATDLEAELAKSRLYSEELGIDLEDGGEPALFRWFLASLLFGTRINEPIAMRTYDSFIRHGLTSPRAILAAGWDYLVNPVMREGRYIRYDESKSAQLLRNCNMLLEKYGGSLENLHEAATSPADLEGRLQKFYRIGPVTTNIFLRELRPLWRHADPPPLRRLVALAESLGLDLDSIPRKSRRFTRIEAGLVRLQHRHPKGARRPSGPADFIQLIEEGLAMGAPPPARGLVEGNDRRL